MAEFNERVARDWIGRDIVVGTGIHYGECILGTLGEAGRMDTTIVSDAVNLASRIEGLTKLYRRPILLSQDVFYRIEDRERFVFRFIDKLRVKGKQDTVSVFEAFHRPEKDGEAIYDFIGRFEKAVLQYYNGEFDAAMLAFNELRTVFPDDHAVQIYRKRCREKQLLKANADPQ
jgi:two-component system sensor histidine kinase ChiS